MVCANEPAVKDGDGFQYIVESQPTLKNRDGGRVWGPAYRNAQYPGEEDGWKQEATTLYELFIQAVGQFGTRPCLSQRPGKYPEANPYQTLTFDQVNERVKALAGGYSKRVARGAAVGVYAVNCVEWMLVMQMTNRLACKCVPLYDTLGEDKVEYIIQHAECQSVALSGDKLATVSKVLPKTNSVKSIVYWGEPPEESVAQAIADAGVELLTIEQVEKEGAGMNVEDPPTPDDLCTIMYTSGTTGVPKGVLLTHRAMVATVTSLLTKIDDEGIPMNENTRYISYLPLAHIFDRTSEECVISRGGHIGYWRGNVLGLIEDAQLFKPTYMAGVPRVYDRVYSRAMGQLAQSTVKRTLFNIAAGRKRAALNKGAEPLTAGGFWDKLVFKKVAAVLGGEINLLVSGGAPLAPHTEDFLRVSMCAVIGQGYGLTETCAGATLVNPRAVDQVATVGIPLPGMQVRLAAVPEMNYDPLADPPRGEVLLKGPQVFSGYYKMEDKSKEVLTEDGWFLTGDVGEWSPSGSLKIIDRVKNIFKLAQGEYVAVEKVEAAYKKNGFVDQIWVYGNSFESSLVAFVVPLPDPLKAWANSSGKSSLSNEELCESPTATKHVLESLQATGRQQKLNGFEIIRAIVLLPEAFTVANDLLTPSYKLKRHELLQRYQKEVDVMYQSLRGNTSKSLA